MIDISKCRTEEFKAQVNKYKRYISTYKQVYPKRPWEDIE